jgi:hypothetical protein
MDRCNYPLANISSNEERAYFMEVLNNPLFLLIVSNQPAVISPKIVTSASILCFKTLVQVSTPAEIARGVNIAIGRATI